MLEATLAFALADKPPVAPGVVAMRVDAAGGYSSGREAVIRQVAVTHHIAQDRVELTLLEEMVIGKGQHLHVRMEW